MRILIMGGAGFIGSNLAFHFLSKGDEVAIFDNFSREGSELNLSWLRENFRENLTLPLSRFRFLGYFPKSATAS